MLEELSTTSNTEDADILNDVYIRWPVELERSLMEGSYTKAWRAKSRAPRKEYEVLAEGLMGTIRLVVFREQARLRTLADLPNRCSSSRLQK